MENHFLKTDDNTIINEKCIRWVKKMNECLEVCVKSNGCNSMITGTTHRICKANSPKEYDKWARLFD
jgi:hypothetical protein